MTRQARDTRRSRGRVQLSSRDVQLLRMLARFRIARTRDLTSLAFKDVRTDTAAARLRRLFDAGYLDVQAGDRSQESVYALGPAGRAFLNAENVQLGRRPTQNIDHHLSIVRTWAQLVTCAQTVPGVAIEVVRPDWEIRAEVGETATLIPDLLVQVRVSTGPGSVPARLAVEVDRGTERNEALRTKLEAYQLALHRPEGLFGWQDVGLAIVLSGPGARRQNAVERLLEEMWNGWWVLWTEADGPQDTLSALAHALQAPLTTSPDDSPNGKGSAGRATDVKTTRSEREGRGLSQ